MTIATTESLEQFRERARDWLAQNMPKRNPNAKPVIDAADDAEWEHARELQQRLYSGGFAGICFPTEYGGLGLPIGYQQAFTAETAGYEMPILLNLPTLGICAATLLDVGSEEQKRQHVAAAIRGEEVLVQFLSEPGGGSDLAGVTTRADRDGDTWVLNGAKIWSTSAYAADWALCLARTDWTVPKHRGLTMFLMRVNQPGVTIRRIEQLDGSTEFCEEFFDDVILPADAVVGEINDGWAVASRLLFHERTAVGGGSAYTSGIGEWGSRKPSMNLVDLARETGQAADVRIRELVGQAYAHRTVKEQLIARVSRAVTQGDLPDSAMAMIRLFHAETDWLDSDVGLEIGGPWSVVGGHDDHAFQMGRHSLSRQAWSLGGGSTEMARNLISERLLRMPREHAPDRELPYQDVKRHR